MAKEFACTGFMCPMVEGHCVKAAKKEGKRQNISDQNVTKRDENICRWHPTFYSKTVCYSFLGICFCMGRFYQAPA